MKFSKCLCKVEFLEAATRDEAIQVLSHAIAQAAHLSNPKAFFEAALQREQIVSTGIGMAVAVPHAKLPAFKDFFLAIGIQKHKGIEWHSPDHIPVRLIFMIGGPDDRQGDYLNLLSQLTSAIKGADFRNELLRAETAEEIKYLFSNAN